MLHRFITIVDPNTRRRLRRFGKIGRAKWSLIILVAIFIISLFSNFIANEKPLLAMANGRLLFPVLKYYSDDDLTGSGNMTRAKFKAIEKTPLFTENRKNWMLWPLIRFGPNETLIASEIEIDETLTIRFSKAARVATLDVDSSLTIQRSRGAAGFYGVSSDSALRRKPLQDGAIKIAPQIESGIKSRFENQASPQLTLRNEGIEYSLSAYTPKSRAPKLVRLSVKEAASAGGSETAIMKPDFTFDGNEPAIWAQLSEANRDKIIKGAASALEVQTEPLTIESSVGKLTVSFDSENVSFPFRPVKSHILGLDESGRDIFVLILYATRIALLFAIALVLLTFLVGVFVGAVQGYFGGKVDMLGQRFTEIWSAMPFLFIMILLSSIYGKGFFLLLFVYAIFNWIGISLYMRAEFLRLRKQPFVEAARVMGINRWKIMFRSILPNALVPVITFFPFELVGAIFALTALDFLGFGLPAGTPSWGDLLQQGKVYPYGWWLVLFPAIALFTVSLLGIFIGEGVRAAFDPRNESKLQ